MIGTLRDLWDDGRPVIIGAGLAGLLTALWLAPMPVLAGAPLGQGAESAWSYPPDAALIRPVLPAAAAVLRTGDALAQAADRLAALTEGDGAAFNPALVARMIVAAAQRRTESRGSPFRTDHPAHGTGAAAQRQEQGRALAEVA